MKRAVAAVFAAVIMCLAYAGCSNKPGQSAPPSGNDNEEITEMFLTVNGNKLTVALAENASVNALVGILEQGDIVYSADDFGGFEKVGSLGHTLPSDDEEITTQAGDVVLYSSNQIVVFYGSNTWAYTRLGKIEGYSATELKTLLGGGSGRVEITLSLN